MKGIVYLSGPITGVKNGNIEAFRQAQTVFECMDYKVLNPHVFCAHIPKSSSWVRYMKECLRWLPDATHIHSLPNWEQSTGALLEKYVAEAIGIKGI